MRYGIENYTNPFSLLLNVPKMLKLGSVFNFGKIEVGQFDFEFIPFRTQIQSEGPIWLHNNKHQSTPGHRGACFFQVRPDINRIRCFLKM